MSGIVPVSKFRYFNVHILICINAHLLHHFLPALYASITFCYCIHLIMEENVKTFHEHVGLKK